MNERLEQLDSLRGLAALSVVFCHFLSILPAIFDQSQSHWFLKYTPIHIFWVGHEAVIFFFVLSGFVLSLQFFKKKVSYHSYIIKRICRIYIPYLACVVLAIIASQLFYSGPKEELSSWFNRAWTVKPSIELIIQHFLLIPSFRNGAFAPVLWSLVHEMRLSILFPLIMIPILKYNWKINISFAALATISSMALMYVLHRIVHYRSDYPLTIHYISMFIFGALLAKHRAELVDWYRSFSKVKKYTLLVMGTVCYLFSWHLKAVTMFSFSVAEDWIISIGVAIFIISAIGSDKLSQMLVLRPVLFLGRTSYSVYLLHTVVLLSLTHLLYGFVDLWIIWILAFGSTLLLSGVSYEFIELPSIAIGRRLVEKQREQQPG